MYFVIPQWTIISIHCVNCISISAHCIYKIFEMILNYLKIYIMLRLPYVTGMYQVIVYLSGLVHINFEQFPSIQ